jgi:type IV pilus assembly protein PilQ
MKGLWIVFVACLAAGCARHAGTPDMPASATAPSTSAAVSAPTQTGGLVLRAAGEGTVLEFPVPTSSEMFVEYDMAQRLIVRFEPRIPSFVLGEQKGGGMVRHVHLHEEGEKVASMQVELSAPARYLLSREGNWARLLVVPGGQSSQETASAAPVVPSAWVDALEFAASETEFVAVVSSSQPLRVVPGDAPEGFELTLPGVQFRPNVLKTYRMEGGGPVRWVQAKNVGRDGRLIFAGLIRPGLTVSREGGVTRIRLAIGALAQAQPVAQAEIKPTAQEQSSAPSPSDEGTLFPGMKKKYSGTPITLDLQEAKVEHVLRLLSEIGGYNLILDEGVSGTISLKLVDIPWDQALDLVLLQKNLGMVQRGNLLRISTMTQLRKENEELQQAREAEARAKESLQNVLPTRTEYIQINYSTAAEFEPKVRELLSPRGKVSSDSRTNTLIVTDIDPVLQRVQSYVVKLDRAERQVLIEARLVYATDDFQRDIGIRWGATMRDESKRDDEQYQWDSSVSGFNAPFGSTGLTLGGTIGKILGKDLWTLDASLRLGETKNLVKTVSSPRIVTLNNNRAEIKQGIKLATSGESQSGGTTTQYTEAVLKISVQPQITPDNKLILDVEVSDDSPTATGRDIETKSARTKMIVGDRETIVIGGVLKSSDRSAEEKIPGLGDIPILGRLFRQDTTASAKQELLIFLQPRIL